MLAVDSAGNESVPTKPVYVLSQKGELPVVGNLEGKYNNKIKAVELTWKLPDISEIEKVLIYRRSGNRGYQLISSVEMEKEAYIDYAVLANTNYCYKIRLKFKGGQLSDFSREALLKLHKR
jgi:hypothetical protein